MNIAFKNILKMKQKFILPAITVILIIASLNPLKAQSVAINTDGSAANGSALLDIKSTTKGMLAPRMNSAQRIAIATPAAGLFVYDTNTNSYWFYNGSAWSNLVSSGSVGWLLTGNSVTNPVTNFIGTTDAQPLRFRINNLWAGEINPVSGNIFMGKAAGEANTNGFANTAFGTSALKNNTNSSYNVAIGDSSLFFHNGTTGGGNTAVGSHTLYSNNDGGGNTAMGYYSLYSNINGQLNTAIGLNTLYNNLSGHENTAMGSRALQFNDGYRNTATGASALRFNSSGVDNIANGYNALYSNSSGFSNTAIGSLALYSNTLGTQNTALGYLSLSNNTIASDNTAIGHSALLSNTTASQNTAVGKNALYNQSFSNGNTAWVSGNTAVGYEALYTNSPTSVTNGINNTGVGLYALRANTVGYDNTAVGVTALNSNTVGYFNTAIGRQALFYNTTGNLNNAFGYKALRFNNGSFNTAYGNNSLENNSTGSYNIAIGPFSLSSNTTGSYNTAIGSDAQNDGINSGYNTILGASAHIAANVNNSIVIGYNAYTNTPNLALLGGPTTGFTGGYSNWSNFSDGRFKKDLDENVRGLDFIMRLRPVTYHMDVRGLYNFWGISPYEKTNALDEKKSWAIMDDAISKKESIRMTGFVAQEVEKAAKESGFNFPGIDVPRNAKEVYTLRYVDFIMPMVKGMQEQQVMIEAMRKVIET